MTEQEVMKWMREYLDGTKAEKSAFGMIKADITDYGFQGFLDMPPEAVIESYMEVTEEISQELVESFKTIFQQEQDIESLGIEQSMRLDPAESVIAMRNGMTDIMRSLYSYIEVQRMANTLIQENEH
tara:strand:- start:8448 stop:8828 length:381 start_codon:yes stop_codon:yes gene_type:complete